MVGSPQSPPRVKVIDMSRSKDKDRFEMPKGSLHFSRAGTQIYGMLDKPSLRVMRWGFEATKAAENEKADAKLHSPPAGRRHDAYYLYLANIRAEERASGHDAAWGRAAERCRRTQRPPHLATSVDNFLHWKAEESPPRAARPSTPQPPSALGPCDSPQGRPSTAPAAASMSPVSWNMWNSPTVTVSSPRFQARAEFEYKRCTTPDPDDARKLSYAKTAAQRTAQREAREQREAVLAAAWPHGMPVAARRAATAACGGDVVPMPLNHGFPLSLPERQYEALKTGMKWY